MKVLVADDSLVMRRLLESTLAGWGYEVVSAKDGREAWVSLQEQDSPRLAILDWMMPVYSGLELCRLTRQLDRQDYTYIILLTSRGLREDIVEGLSAGADDYVVKPFDQHELEVRLRAGRRIIELQAQLVKAQAALREQATRDALTKAWNRGSILEILEHELERGRREQRSLGLMMMDLDHFKLVNDGYGHLTGDYVLREAAHRMTMTMRSYDSFGRYGGEEFLIVVPGSDESSLRAHAERLRAAIESEPFRVSGGSIRVTASFGASAVGPDQDVTTDQLIRAADDALYEAKRKGRNEVAFMAPESAAKAD
jgi:two-component system, cell cycle response regulator